MDPLARLEALDTLRELLTVLTPKQQVVVALRYQGLNDHEIGELLGLEHRAVSMRMTYAQVIIARELPHLAPAIAGRDRNGTVYRRSNDELADVAGA